MNKFLLVIIVLLTLISCGKKGDPVYEAINDSHSINSLV